MRFGRIERVNETTFCEIDRCAELASWRIGYDVHSVRFCTKHTMSTMRNRRLWLRAP